MRGEGENGVLGRRTRTRVRYQYRRRLKGRVRRKFRVEPGVEVKFH